MFCVLRGMTNNRKVWNKRVDDIMEKLFVDEYLTGVTAKSIAMQHGFKTAKTVFDVLIKHGVKRRAPKIQTHYNETFFDVIDTYEKAYFLGLMATDGYIVKDYAGFGIQLTADDSDILLSFAKLLGMSRKLCRIDYSKRRLVMPGAKDCIRLEVKNRPLAEGLRKQGVVRRKTNIIRYRKNQVCDKLLPAFFRGLWDGDGNITITKNPSRFECTLSSASRMFVQDLCRALRGKFVSTVRVTSPSKQSTTDQFLLRIKGGYEAGKAFAKWIYGCPTNVRIERKYARVKDYIG